MTASACLLLLALSDLPQVDVTTLSGGSLTGRLISLSSESLELVGDGQPVRVPTSELLLVQVTSNSSGGTPTAPPVPDANPAAAGPAAVVTLLDGSQLTATQISMSTEAVSLVHPTLGTIPIPRSRVRSVRLAADDPAVAESWKELQQRAKKQDYLVIRKGDVLDHLDGVVGALDDATLKFLLDGDQIEVKRARAFGWIYAQEPPKSAASGVRVTLSDKDTVVASGVAWDGQNWAVSLPGMKVPASLTDSAVRSIDFSAGRVLYLSSQEPRDLEHVPYFGPGGDWPYQRDRNLFGRPLKVGTRTFSRGLALHSKTRLIYRIGGDYRRLAAIVGIDPELQPNAEPAINNARLIIRGDKKVLFDADVRAGDPPLPLDLPVANVIELEILVDFGQANLDIGDRVHFGDLKVLK
ncbi:MAG: NPCBM/NEW2 domain-containing protein [Planctomycetaceae bacterium]|nr:NPCBM/NEW2 domain-containing protein [Planctomycetaceae bacterium]